jgi:hypothetical protein
MVVLLLCSEGLTPLMLYEELASVTEGKITYMLLQERVI